MGNEYDQITAFHYSAFRPDLHHQILEECVVGANEYTLGLDIGCGTGHSAIALSNHCQKVLGIEPSTKMLEQSIQHPKVEYSYYDRQHIDFPNNYFDIITFAGSLFYAKSQELLEEVIRVGKDASLIVIYDFKIILDPIREKLIQESVFQQNSTYDHQVNFDGLIQHHIQLRKKQDNALSLNISFKNLAHLLLSSKDSYYSLSNAIGKENLYEKIVEKLRTIFMSDQILIKANTYSTVYQIIK